MILAMNVKIKPTLSLPVCVCLGLSELCLSRAFCALCGNGRESSRTLLPRTRVLPAASETLFALIFSGDEKREGSHVRFSFRSQWKFRCLFPKPNRRLSHTRVCHSHRRYQKYVPFRGTVSLLFFHEHVVAPLMLVCVSNRLSGPTHSQGACHNCVSHREKK